MTCTYKSYVVRTRWRRYSGSWQVKWPQMTCLLTCYSWWKWKCLIFEKKSCCRRLLFIDLQAPYKLQLILNQLGILLPRGQGPYYTEYNMQLMNHGDTVTVRYPSDTWMIVVHVRCNQFIYSHLQYLKTKLFTRNHISCFKNTLKLSYSRE
jgi:hypothetical protein